MKRLRLLRARGDTHIRCTIAISAAHTSDSTILGCDAAISATRLLHVDIKYKLTCRIMFVRSYKFSTNIQSGALFTSPVITMTYPLYCTDRYRPSRAHPRTVSTPTFGKRYAAMHATSSLQLTEQRKHRAFRQNKHAAVCFIRSNERSVL